MSELADLRGRVEQAVDRLSSAHDARRGQNDKFTRLLADLEGKFTARTQELEYCNRRIEALTLENQELTGLVDRLVGMIEVDPDGGREDPLFRASEMAAELIGSWSEDGAAPAETDAANEPAVDAGPEEVAPSQLEAALETALDSAPDSGPDMAFEDVSAEELAAERLDAPAGDMPDEVIQAVAAALDIDGGAPPDGEFVDRVVEEISDALNAMVEDSGELAVDDAVEFLAEDLDVDLDIPENEAADEATGMEEAAADTADEEDTESSIRAMMARLEQAAAKARATVEAEGESGEGDKPAKDGSERAA